MDIKNEAHEYALKAMESALTKIEDAYIAGYEAGKKVGFKPIEIDENGIEWVDMSLPSGTLWSKALRKDGECIEAVYNEVKDYNLPTEEDVAELFKGTKRFVNNGWIKILSRNGIEYWLNDTYWLKGSADENLEVPYMSYKGNCDKTYMGYKKKVILVKHPNMK